MVADEEEAEALAAVRLMVTDAVEGIVITTDDEEDEDEAAEAEEAGAGAGAVSDRALTTRRALIWTSFSPRSAAAPAASMAATATAISSFSRRALHLQSIGATTQSQEGCD